MSFFKRKQALAMPFTALGRATLFFSVSLFIAGLTSGANLLFLISTLLVSLLLFAGILGFWQLHKLSVRLKMPEKVIKNESFILSILK